MFGAAEKKQLKTHNENLVSAKSFGNYSQSTKRSIVAAIEEAIIFLFTRLNLDNSIPLYILVAEMPYDLCNDVADFLMKASEEPENSQSERSYYYALDILCGIFRTKAIEAKQPKLKPSATIFRNNALEFIDYCLSHNSNKLLPVSIDIHDVENYSRQFGFALTRFGANVAVKSIENGYSPAETASKIAVLMIAREARNKSQDQEAFLRLTIRGYAVLEYLKELADSGHIRKSIWRNDSTAIANIINPTPETKKWIERVLIDPVGGEGPVATFQN